MDTSNKMTESEAGVSNIARPRPLRPETTTTNNVLRDLRQDLNVLAQHFVAFRRETQDKFKTLSQTSNNFEKNTQEVFEEMGNEITESKEKQFSDLVSKIIEEDNEASRKKLFEDIERAIDKSTSKQKSSYQWVINIVLILGLGLLSSFVLILLKG